MMASGDVSPEVENAARAVAEAHPDTARSMQADRVVYVATERQGWKAVSSADPLGFLYRVIHYRYDDGTAIHTTVDMQNSTALERREIPHLPTPLGPDEISRARSLARSNDRVRAELGDQLEDVVVLAIPMYISDEEDRWFGRRIVSLFFKLGEDYIAGLDVVVDLTHENVEVTVNRGIR